MAAFAGRQKQFEFVFRDGRFECGEKAVAIADVRIDFHAQRRIGAAAQQSRAGARRALQARLHRARLGQEFDFAGRIDAVVDIKLSHRVGTARAAIRAAAHPGGRDALRLVRGC